MTKKRRLSNSSQKTVDPDKMLEMVKLFEQSSKDISILKYSDSSDVESKMIGSSFDFVKIKTDHRTSEKSKQESQNNQKNQEKTIEEKSQKKKSHPTKCSKSKSEIKKFLKANKNRGLSRKEIMEFLGVSRMSIVEKIFLEQKISIKLTDILVDLRTRKLEGDPIIPGVNDEKKVENSKVTNSVNDISDIEDKSTNNDESENIKTDKSESVNNEKSQNDEEISNEEKKVIPLSNLLNNNCKIHNYIMDLSILDMSTENFTNLLDDLIKRKPKEIPVFWLYRSDFESYDKHKDSKNIARSLIRFFSQDNDRFFSRLINQIRPERDNLAKLCAENEITLISGSYRNIIESKLNNVDVIIPRIFKERFPNPLKGDKVYGFDSSAIIHSSRNEIDNILATCKKVIISDLQYNEIHYGNASSSYFLKVIAYYGEIYKATNYKESDLPDSRILKFYTHRRVDMVFTDDSGFILNGAFRGVPCSLVGSRDSLILQKLKDCMKFNCSYFENQGISENVYVKFDCFNNYNNKLNACINYNDEKFTLNVFCGKNKKRILTGPYINGDVICIRSNNTVLICIMTDCKNLIAEMWYFGDERNVPTKYRGYLI